MQARSHESEERLELYALGRLPDSVVIAVEEHLLMCDACRDRLDKTAGEAFLIRDAPRDNPVPFRTGRFEWLRPKFAFAGALAAAILAVVFLWRGSSAVAPVANLQLTAMRGAGVQIVQPSQELDLTFVDGAGASKAEVVDGNGALVWSGAPELVGGVAQAKVVKALSPGEYFARVYDSAGRMLHEYGFEVRGGRL